MFLNITNLLGSICYHSIMSPVWEVCAKQKDEGGAGCTNEMLLPRRVTRSSGFGLLPLEMSDCYCPLCSGPNARFTNLREYLKHVRLRHSDMPGFRIECGCPRTFTKFSTHLYAYHASNNGTVTQHRSQSEESHSNEMEDDSHRWLNDSILLILNKWLSCLYNSMFSLYHSFEFYTVDSI